jgi:hypothetical protein
LFAAAVFQEASMSEHRYDSRHTALLLVDPYNDFLSDGGKLWPMVKGVADEVGLLWPAPPGYPDSLVPCLVR